jgi:ubiquinone/menaquinone biosynthesis C-methylase UbiE
VDQRYERITQPCLRLADPSILLMLSRHRVTLPGSQNEHRGDNCSVSHLSAEHIRRRNSNQSTLRAGSRKDVMEHSVAPPTKGLIIRWAARYDLLAWILTRGRERALRERFVDLARLEAGNSVLDIGCGTGTLAIAAAHRVGPTGSVFGIDASPPMVARATRKAARAGVNVVGQLAPAEQLPYSDNRFDVVLSTLMLHHLPRTTRQQCAREIRRVLKPGGRVLAVDFGGRQHRGVLAHFHRHGHVPVEDIVGVLENAGLTTISKGEVGMNDLQFVLAEAPTDARADKEA